MKFQMYQIATLINITETHYNECVNLTRSCKLHLLSTKEALNRYNRNYWYYSNCDGHVTAHNLLEL